MSSFDSKLFGQNLKKYRKLRELSQENIATLLGKSKATISKYENGDLIMNADDISKVCEELNIFSADLFEQEYKNINRENNKNPFKSDKLYMYFNAYDNKKHTFCKGKYLLKIIERPDFIRVNFCDADTEKIYLMGYMHADKCATFITFENYEPNNGRLEHSIIEINVSSGISDLMLGIYFGTNAQYVPSVRKAFFSTKDVIFTDEMLKQLKPTEQEIEYLKNNQALYLDIFNY